VKELLMSKDNPEAPGIPPSAADAAGSGEAEAAKLDAGDLPEGAPAVPGGGRPESDPPTGFEPSGADEQ
jgi:hypothetical protein